MSILDKVMFWKRDELGLKEDLALPKGNLPTDELGLESSVPRTPQMPQPEPRIESFEGARPYAPAAPPPQPQFMGPNRDMELVSAKLDALKASLDSINQRLANLERVAYGDEEQRKVW